MWGVPLTFAAVFVFFSVDLPGVFLTGTNMAAITNAALIDALIAAGLVMPLVMNDFDLSVASVAGLSGAVAIVLMANHGWSPAPAIIVALLSGVVFGLLNGFLVAVMNTSSFITTLAIGSVVVGVEFLLTGQQTIISGVPTGFTDIGSADLGGVILPVFIAVAIIAIGAFILSHTVPGREVYAVGANSEAARLSGVRVRRLRITGFVVSATLAALAGLFLVAILGNSSPNVAAGHLLPAFAAAFLGSTLFPSRRFSIVGAAAAAWFLEMVAIGLVQENLETWTISVFNGVVLILAILAALNTRRFAR